MDARAAVSSIEHARHGRRGRVQAKPAYRRYSVVLGGEVLGALVGSALGDLHAAVLRWLGL